MKVVSDTDVLELANSPGDYFVSFYMPTYPSGEQRKQNRIRFGKLIHAAEDLLLQKGMRLPEAQTLLVPTRRLLCSPLFWAKLTRGLAMFVARDASWVWHLPDACQELCVVGKRFHITPLLPWATNGRRYFVLAVSQNRVRLLEGTPADLQEIAVSGMPASLRDALPLDHPAGSFQSHSGQPRLRGKEGLVFHGQGGLPDATKQNITSFFRQIDHAVVPLLRLHEKPLLFAGVDYLFPLYCQVNTYPHLLPEHLPGNPDLLPLPAIQVRALEIVDSLQRRNRDDQLEKYWTLVSRGRATNRLLDILVAAHAGGVETLYVAPAGPLLGTFDPRTSTLRIDEQPRHDNEDLVNLAAIVVLRHSGKVRAIPLESMPDAQPLAAILSYPAALCAAGQNH